ncbi:TPA: hypothetical protein U2T46_002978 [Burkholderia cenocepacia]|nr:hypothetical protein [Burkholderia cenocepacia]
MNKIIIATMIAAALAGCSKQSEVDQADAYCQKSEEGKATPWIESNSAFPAKLPKFNAYGYCRAHQIVLMQERELAKMREEMIEQRKQYSGSSDLGNFGTTEQQFEALASKFSSGINGSAYRYVCRLEQMKEGKNPSRECVLTGNVFFPLIDAKQQEAEKMEEAARAADNELGDCGNARTVLECRQREQSQAATRRRIQ